MIRGAQKQMLVVRTGGSRYFDGAYFVLRRELPRRGEGREDILREANRILEESGLDPRPPRRCRRGWLLFGAGLLVGAGIALGMLLLLL